MLPRAHAGLAVLLAASCSGSTQRSPVLVAPDDVPASSQAPQLVRIQDLGAPRVLKPDHQVNGSSDGVAVVGEVLLVDGERFGRQPRVKVAGQQAPQVGRTRSGGILVRVPWGVRVGSQPVEVMNQYGTSQQRFLLRRYALATVPSGDALHVLEVDPSGARRSGKPIAVRGAGQVRYSTDGQLAYVGGRGAEGHLTLSIVDMAASGGPRLLETERLPGKHLLALTAAENAPLAAALTDTHLVFVDSRDATGAAFRPQALPGELRDGVLTADMDGEGKLLAVLLPRGNRVTLYDLSDIKHVRLLATTQVLPKAHASLVRDMRFSSDSSTLWVISGDNAESVGKGHSPLRLTVIKIQMSQTSRSKSFGILSLWRTLDVPHQAAPVDLAVAKGQPGAGGVTVRVPPSNAAVFITTHRTSLLKLAHTRFDEAKGLHRAVEMLMGILQRENANLGTLLRADLAGKADTMFDSASLLGPVDITSDTQLLLVAGAKVEVYKHPDAVRLVYGITTARVFGAPSPHFIALAEVDPKSLARPFLLGDVRVQP